MNDIHNVKLVSSGDTFVIALCHDNSLWSKGKNNFGQLGLDHRDNREIFTQIQTNEIFISISCGNDHSLLLTETQKVFSCGSNQFGQIACKENIKQINKLKQITKLPRISMISCSSFTSFCVDINGNLITFGKYDENYVNEKIVPELCFNINQIMGIPPVKFISKSHSRIVVLDINGGLWYLGKSYADKNRFSSQKLEPIDNCNYYEYFGDLPINDLCIQSFVENKKFDYVSNFWFNSILPY